MADKENKIDGYVCDICTRVYATEKGCLRHRYSHESVQKTMPFKCHFEECHHRFMNEYNLLKHIAKLHSNTPERVLVPHITGDSTPVKRSASLTRRLLVFRHESKDEEPDEEIVNDDASSKLCNSSSLQQLDSYSFPDTKGDAHKCRYCIRTFRNSIGLIVHTRRTHMLN